MINNKSITDLRNIALAGASLEIDGSRYSANDMRTIALAISEGCFLTVRNSDKLSVADMRQVALAGGKKVTFS